MKNQPFPTDPEILDRVSEGIFSLDTNWQFTYMNKTAKKMLALYHKSGDLIGKNIWREFPQLRKLPQYKYVKNILKDQKIIMFEMVSPISNEWRHFAFYPSKKGISVILRNIDKEKKAEQLLLQEKKWSGAILSSIQDGFVVVDRKLTYLFLNKKGEEIIGIPREKLLGKKVSDTFPDHNLDIVSLLRVVKRAWVEKKVAELEIFFKPLNCWYAITVYPFEDKFSVLFRDITEKKRVQEELQGSKAQLDMLFKHVSDAIFIQNEAGKFLYVNDAAAIACGFKNFDEMRLHTSFNHLDKFDLFDAKGNRIAPEDLPARQVFQRKKSDVEMVIKGIDKHTKHVMWATVKTTEVPQGDPSKRLVVSIMRDITKLKEVEEQKDDFISIVSHELRTPLTSMKVYMQILHARCMDIGNDQLSTVLEKVDKNIDRLSELVQTILDVSRAERGMLALHKKRFSLSSLVTDVIDNLQPITAHPLSLISSSKTVVYADKDRIMQVMINLLMNAIKYSEGNKKIIIRVFQENKKSIVSVEDFGIGIPIEEQEQIFGRFFQSHKHSTYPGMGLGLHISSEIMKAHGGKLWVKSTEGKGSTFYFAL